MSEQDQLQVLAVRLGLAISRFERDHDFGIIWDFDGRKANVAVGPNALAGFAYATGEAENLNRFEAIVLACEEAADASEARSKANADEWDDHQ